MSYEEAHAINEQAHGKLSDHFCRYTLFFMLGYMASGKDNDPARRTLFDMVKHELEKQQQ